MTHTSPNLERPSRWARLWLALLCPWHLREEVMGDLQELYSRRAAGCGARHARRMYLRDLRSLVRLAAAGEGNRSDQFDFLIAQSKQGGTPMTAFGQDVRYGLRQLARTPLFTIVTVLTLALGIGANTAIFSVVDAVLLRPLPFQDSERLVNVWNKLPEEGLPQMWLSEPEFLFYRQHQRIFDGLSVYSSSGGNLTGNGDPQRVSIVNVSDGFFSTLGIQPMLGRTFAPEEDTPGNDRVLLLEHGFWKRRFGGDPGVVNKEVNLNGQTYLVVGVMPQGFAFPPGGVDMWTPLAIDTASPSDRGSHYLLAVARLQAGIALANATQEMDRLAKEMDDPYNYKARGWGAYVVPLRDAFVGDSEVALLALLGAVGFVLLIACANVANLMLARAAAREKEIAIRFALGSGRWRITRQLLTESLLLALAGAFLGTLLAYWIIPPLTTLASDQVPQELSVGVDSRVLAFTLTIAVFTGLFFGIVPAWQAARADLQGVLTEGGRSSATGLRQRFRQALVISEVAVALVLLIGGGLMLRSFSSVLRVHPGYSTESVLSFRLALPATRYDTPAKGAQFFRETLGRIQTLPGVRNVGAISHLPLAGLTSSGSVFVEDLPPTQQPFAFGYFETDLRATTPSFRDVMGLALVSGRWLEPGDGPGAPRVVVVDETFARRAWPDKDPIGRRVSFTQDSDGTQRWRTVVGVIRHVKHYGLTTDGREQMYYPLDQADFGGRAMFVVARGPADPKILLNSIQGEVAKADPELPAFDVHTMEERLAASVGFERLTVVLVGGFAVLALVLASVGIYGVISYSVTQRTREIGVRMALGAAPREILGMVLRSGLLLTLVGIALGLAAGLGLTRLIQSLLFGVSATDPATFVVVPLLLTAVAALACLIPARRAARVDPMIALRYE
jgi:putative ABC transport system permease protein